MAERMQRGRSAGEAGAEHDDDERSLRAERVVQRRQAAARRVAAAVDGGVQTAAAEGVTGAGEALPHREAIQRSFGHHDVSGIEAHVGGAAATASERIGAEAYATGNHVAFRGAPDLHTAAHEAAHVMQQRQGVQLKGGVGEAGDAYERHADAVADRVVAGDPVEDLIDRITGRPRPQAGAAKASSSPAAGPVQRQVTVGGKVSAKEGEVEALWAEVEAQGPIQALEAEQRHEARAILHEWVTAPPLSKDFSVVSQNREYTAVPQLASALAGEIHAQANLAKEGELAHEVYSSEHIMAKLGGFLKRVQEFDKSTGLDKVEDQQKLGRYSYFYSSKEGQEALERDNDAGGLNSVGAALANPPGSLEGQITLLADYALMIRKFMPKVTQQKWELRLGKDEQDARGTHWNPKEEARWTTTAREHAVPLSAGPSATTAQLLTLATQVGASVEDKEALAWAIFAFFNKDLKLFASGTHRFHEVMTVARAYGVPYTPWEYGETPQAKKA